jgi:hypothetical protein
MLAYSVFGEAHRYRLSACIKQPSLTFADSAFTFIVHSNAGRMEGEDADRLRGLLKLKQFCEQLNPYLHRPMWHIDWAPKTLSDAVGFADEYRQPLFVTSCH